MWNVWPQNMHVIFYSFLFLRTPRRSMLTINLSAQLFWSWDSEFKYGTYADQRMQIKCAPYYFARQNCSACTQQHTGARGTRFNVVKSFVRKFHSSAACSPCLDCILRKQRLMKLCKNDVVWNSEKMCFERQHREGSFNFKPRNRGQNLLLSTNQSSVHLFVLGCNGRVFAPSKFRRNVHLSFEAQL